MYDVNQIRPSARDDFSLPFVIGGGAVRGRIVRISTAVDVILNRHNDPAPVGELLGQAMVAAVALSSGLKYDGIFTFQVSGNGPVRTLVTDLTSAGDLRACARFDRERLDKELAKGRPEHLQPHLLGTGHLTFTVDQGPDTDRYQGIVELTGGSLSDSVHHYFRQSEQLPSAIKMAVLPPSAEVPHWRAGGVVLQRMPDSGLALSSDELEDFWRTAVVLMGSVTDSELISGELLPDRLAYRLFGTLGCAPGTPKLFRAQCRCSHARTGRILASFPAQEIKSFAEAGVVRMTCEFCRAEYLFTESEIDSLQAAADAPGTTGA